MFFLPVFSEKTGTRLMFSIFAEKQSWEFSYSNKNVKCVVHTEVYVVYSIHQH